MTNWFTRNGKILINANGKLRGCCCDTADCDWVFTFTAGSSYSGSWSRRGGPCPTGTLHFNATFNGLRVAVFTKCGHGDMSFFENGTHDYDVVVDDGDCESVGYGCYQSAQVTVNDWWWEPDP